MMASAAPSRTVYVRFGKDKKRIKIKPPDNWAAFKKAVDKKKEVKVVDKDFPDSNSEIRVMNKKGRVLSESKPKMWPPKDNTEFRAVEVLILHNLVCS